jgi:exopolyphosphatase/guanosine-5'-triphosphate,3'-diphosphate pyrophosphatase
VVVDVGGGSTELTWGDGPLPRGRVSLQLGAVRLTERIVTTDPIAAPELDQLVAAASEALRDAAARAGAISRGRLVGVAGTVTTLAAVRDGLVTYDAERVHGSTLRLEEVDALLARLAALTVAERQALPGMEPKRADVIVAGAAIVSAAARALDYEELTVSDRGVRWGLLYDRFSR